jgi:hypothetical protein
MPGWQDMRTAPKSRTIVFVPGFGITIVIPCNDGDWWSDELRDTCQPTLWWPMPPLPGGISDIPSR